MPNIHETRARASKAVRVVIDVIGVEVENDIIEQEAFAIMDLANQSEMVEKAERRHLDRIAKGSVAIEEEFE